MPYQHVKVPADGARITIRDGKLQVPDRPIIPFIEGDGTGPDIWRASVRVLDAAVAKAYGGRRKIAWMEVYAGEKAFKQEGNWLPDETVEAFREFLVGIKGPLTTPIGGGIRSLNVALRQMLDLYVCLRPVRWFEGVPSPVKHPEKVNMVIFRENTEDIYAGIEFESGTEDAQQGPGLPQGELPEGLRQGALPGDDGGRLQAGVGRGQRAAHPGRDRVRAREPAEERDVRPQGQHHEVHRGRLPQLGLRPRRARVRRPRLHLGPVGADEEGEGRGGGERRAEGGPRLGEAAGQGRDRGHHAAAGADAAGRVRRHRDTQPERRLPLRRPRRAGGRHRHRPRRQHQLQDRPRRLRGHPRHRAQVREPRQGEPGLARAVRAR